MSDFSIRNTGMTHESFVGDDEVKSSSDRSFGVVFTLLFAVIGVWPLMGGGKIRLWALGAAGLLLIIALARPIWLAAGNRLWTRFGLLLHRITNPIVMGLVFFLAVTPTALILRMMGKDSLRRKIDRTATSYWIDREPPGPAPDSMTDQF
jgi:hypothetical protein